MAESLEYQKRYDTFLKIFKRDRARPPNERDDFFIKALARNEKTTAETFLDHFLEFYEETLHKVFVEHFTREPVDFEKAFIQTCCLEGRNATWMFQNLPEKSTIMSIEGFSREMEEKSTEKTSKPMQNFQSFRLENLKEPILIGFDSGTSFRLRSTVQPSHR